LSTGLWVACALRSRASGLDNCFTARYASFPRGRAAILSACPTTGPPALRRPRPKSLPLPQPIQQGRSERRWKIRMPTTGTEAACVWRGTSSPGCMWQRAGRLMTVAEMHGVCSGSYHSSCAHSEGAAVGAMSRQHRTPSGLRPRAHVNVGWTVRRDNVPTPLLGTAPWPAASPPPFQIWQRAPPPTPLLPHTLTPTHSFVRTAHVRRIILRVVLYPALPLQLPELNEGGKQLEGSQSSFA